MRKLILLLLMPLVAYATDINITNIPAATGSAAADKVLGVTNSVHAALIPIQQIMDLTTASLLAGSNAYSGSFSGNGTGLTNVPGSDIFAASNNVFTASNRFTGPVTITTTGVVSILDFPTNAAVPANPPIGRIRTYSVGDNGFVQLENITDLGIRNRLNQDVKRVFRNVQGAPITAGQPVYVFNGTATRSNVKLAKSDSITTMPVVAIATATVADNAFGEFMVVGKLTGIKTDYASWTEGDRLYVSDTVSGTLTNVAPLHPSFSQWVGLIDFADPVNGIISINVKDMLGVEDGTVSQTFKVGTGTNIIGSAGSSLNGVGLTNGVVTGALAGNANTATVASYVTQNPLTNTIDISSVTTPGQILTNGNAALATFKGSLCVTGANYLALSNGTARVLMTNGTTTTSGAITAGGKVTGAGLSSGNGNIENGGYLQMNSKSSLHSQTSQQLDLLGATAVPLTNINFWDSSISGGGTNGMLKHIPGVGPTFAFLNSTSGPADVIVSGTLTVTNGIVMIIKPSFTTNFTCTTNIQTYCCNGTNQLVTLPNAAYVPNVIYRFSTTNGRGSFILTNATGAQTIRDGTSLSLTTIGIGEVGVFSDGAHWWLASKAKTIFPNAQFSCTTNIPIAAANTAYHITFNSTDFNNSQGIALDVGTNGFASRIWITNAGQYEFGPSIVQAFGGANTIRFWFTSNDTNIPNSCTPSKGANNATRVVTVPFVVNNPGPTAYEILVESDSTTESLPAGAAAGNYPAAPSIICPVKRISDTWP